MFSKIVLFCPFYMCLVLLWPTYSSASSIYRQNINSNSRSNGTFNAINSKEGLDRTESIKGFSLNTDEAQADCKCKNGYCVNNGKRDICTCPTGWGLYYVYECRECDCGKGINCTFDDKRVWRVDKYCLCPDGITLRNVPCKEINPTISPLNISTPVPDLKTTINNSIWTTPNNTLVDFLTTKPSNYSRDYNLTTIEVRSTPLSTTAIAVNTTTVSPVNNTLIDTTATATKTVDTTVTSSEKPSTSDRGVEVIFRNDYTIRNLTEVIIKM